jgi:hypothetical protein
MSALKITGLTVSLDLKRSTYGTGGAPVEERFVSLRADVPTPADGVSLDEALVRSMQMHLTAWESVYAAELAAKNMTQAEFTERRESLHKRTAKLITFLKENTHE